MIEVLQYLVIIFGYIAPLVFIFGIAYRIWGWGRLPIGAGRGLFPKPSGTVTGVIWKGLALPTLFSGDKLFWIAFIAFHLSLFYFMAGHIFIFISPAALGISPETVDLTVKVATYAGGIALVAIIYFIFRRIAITRSREISTFGDHFWLWVLLIIIGIAVITRLFNLGENPDVYRAFVASVITLSPSLPPPNLWFLTHALLGLIFLIYFPFGKPIHAIGQFFNQYILVKPLKGVK